MDNKNYNYIIKHIRSVNEINTPPIKKRKMTVDRYYKNSFKDAINYLGIQKNVDLKIKNKIRREKMRIRQKYVLEKLLERAKEKKIKNKKKFKNISEKVIQEYEKKSENKYRNQKKINELMSFF